MSPNVRTSDEGSVSGTINDSENKDIVTSPEAEQPEQSVAEAAELELEAKIAGTREKIAGFKGEELKPIKAKLNGDLDIIKKELVADDVMSKEFTDRIADLMAVLDSLNKVVEKATTKIVEKDKKSKSDIVNSTISQLEHMAELAENEDEKAKIYDVIRGFTGNLSSIKNLASGVSKIDSPVGSAVSIMEEKLADINRRREEQSQEIESITDPSNLVASLADLSSLDAEGKDLEEVINQLREHSNRELDQLVFNVPSEIDSESEVEVLNEESVESGEEHEETGDENEDEEESEEDTPEKKKKVIDFTMPVMIEVIKQNREHMGVVVKQVAKGEVATAKESADKLFDNLSPVVMVEFEKQLENLGYTVEEFQDHWKEQGLGQKMVESLQYKVAAKKREKAAERISTIERIRKTTNWGSVAKKAALIGGVVGLGAITGFGALAAGAVIGIGGILRRRKMKKEAALKAAGEQSEEMKLKQEKEQALMAEKEDEVHADVVAEIMGDDNFLAEILGQTTREGSAIMQGINPEEINGHIMYTNTLEQLSKIFESQGEAEKAQETKLQTLLEGFKTRVSLEKAGEMAKKDPKLIKMAEMIVKYRSGTAEVAEKDKILDALAYVAPVAIGAAVVLSMASSGTSTAIVRGALAGVGAGYAGFRAGEAWDNRDQKKNMKAEIKKIMGDVENTLLRADRPSDAEARMQIQRLEGHLRMGSLDSDPLLKARAESMLREYNRQIERYAHEISSDTEISPEQQTQKLESLISGLESYNQRSTDLAKQDIDRVYGEKKAWKKWVGLAGGMVLGFAIGSGAVKSLLFGSTEVESSVPTKESNIDKLGRVGEEPIEKLAPEPTTPPDVSERVVPERTPPVSRGGRGGGRIIRVPEVEIEGKVPDTAEVIPNNRIIATDRVIGTGASSGTETIKVGFSADQSIAQDQARVFTSINKKLLALREVALENAKTGDTTLMDTYKHQLRVFKDAATKGDWKTVNEVGKFVEYDPAAHSHGGPTIASEAPKAPQYIDTEYADDPTSARTTKPAGIQGRTAGDIPGPLATKDIPPALQAKDIPGPLKASDIPGSGTEQDSTSGTARPKVGKVAESSLLNPNNPRSPNFRQR